MQSEIQLAKSLNEAVVVARKLALSIFVREMMVALAKENYRLNDLAEALAEYASQRPDWEEVVKLLEATSQEVVKAKQNLQGE